MPKSLEELTQDNINAVKKLEEAEKSLQSCSDKVAKKITKFIGSVVALWVHIVWFVLWIGFNLTVKQPFDEFPFVLLTTIISMEAIFLAIFILISQNNDSQVSESRNKLDLQINLLAEQETTQIISDLNDIKKQLGLQSDVINSMSDPTQPESLVQQIKDTEED